MAMKINNNMHLNEAGIIIPIVLVWAVMFILSAVLFIFSPKSAVASNSVALFYTVWVAVSLNYALKNKGLGALKLPGKRWLISILAGVAMGIFSVMGNNQTPEFRDAALIDLPFLSLFTLFVTGTIAAFCEVVMIMGYYHFSLEKRFGAVLAVLITAFTWTAYHFMLLFSPGSIPSTSGGVVNFIIGIFIGSLIITSITSFTKSILAAFMMNMISNIFINWLRMSISPQDVLIADNSFPIVGSILVIAYVAGMIYVQWRVSNRSSDIKEPNAM